MNIRRSTNTCSKISALIAVIVASPVVAFGDTTSIAADVPAQVAPDAAARAIVAFRESGDVIDG